MVFRKKKEESVNIQDSDEYINQTIFRLETLHAKIGETQTPKNSKTPIEETKNTTEQINKDDPYNQKVKDLFQNSAEPEHKENIETKTSFFKRFFAKFKKNKDTQKIDSTTTSIKAELPQQTEKTQRFKHTALAINIIFVLMISLFAAQYFSLSENKSAVPETTGFIVEDSQNTSQKIVDSLDPNPPQLITNYILPLSFWGNSLLGLDIFADLEFGDYAINFVNDNVIVDCAGHKIIGTGEGTGILNDRENITIKNCFIENFAVGIHSYKEITLENCFFNNNSIEDIHLTLDTPSDNQSTQQVETPFVPAISNSSFSNISNQSFESDIITLHNIALDFRNEEGHTAGSFNFIKGNSGKYDIEFNTRYNSRRIYIRDADPSQNITAKLVKYNGAGPSNTNITTRVFAIDSISSGRTSIALNKFGEVNKILRCPNFDFINFSCPAWEKTNIEFSDEGDHIEFEVNSFSGYAGGQDMSLGSQSVTCGAISTDTTLTQNLNSEGTCFNILNSDLTLDCAGYSITGIGSADAIVSNNNLNVIIKNCVIDQFQTGIVIDNGNNVTVFNNIIKNVALGGDTAAGITVINTTAANISGNTIVNLTADNFGGPGGIKLIETSGGNCAGSVISNNIIQNITGDGENIGRGISLGDKNLKSLNNIRVSNNNISNINCTNPDPGDPGPANACFRFQGGIGISISAGSNINISGNSIANSGTSISPESSSLVLKNNIFNSNYYGIKFGQPTGPDTGAGINNTLIENNTLLFQIVGIQLEYDSKNNLFLNNNFTSNSKGIIDTSSSINRLIYNNSFGQINWTLTNISFNDNLSIGTNLFLENNKIGLADLATLSNLNTSTKIEIKSLSYSTMPKLLKNGIRCDLSDVCNTTYSSNILYADITSFSNYTTQENLTYITNCSSITSSGKYTLNTSFWANGTVATPSCFEINANHVILDGAGQTVYDNTSFRCIGLGAGTPISNITIKNIKCINFSEGLFISNNVSNFTLENSELNFNSLSTDGIYGNGNNITIRNNNLTTAALGGTYCRLISVPSNSPSATDNPYNWNIINNTFNSTHDSQPSSGVCLKRVNDSTISHNSFYFPNSYAIQNPSDMININLNSKNIVISNNNFYETYKGIHINSSSNISILNNLFEIFSGEYTGSPTYSINTVFTSLTNISNNLITTNVNSLTPVLIVNKSNSTNLINNTIANSGSSGGFVASFSPISIDSRDCDNSVNYDNQPFPDLVTVDNTPVPSVSGNSNYDVACVDLGPDQNTTLYIPSATGANSCDDLLGLTCYGFVNNVLIKNKQTSDFSFNDSAFTSSINVTSGQTYPVFLNYDISLNAKSGLEIYDSAGLVIRNNNFSSSPIYDDGSYSKTVQYSNDWGEISWSSLVDFSIYSDLSIGTNLFLENNTIGLANIQGVANLNFPAQITFNNLSYESQPWLMKNGERSDNLSTCNITSFTEGVLIADVTGFSNYSTQTTPPLDPVPNIILINPPDKAGDNDGKVTFTFNVLSSYNIDNCSIVGNMGVLGINTSINKFITNSFELSNIPAGKHTWHINCTDSQGQSNVSETRDFGIVLTNTFDGGTTDLTNINLHQIPNFVVEKSAKGKINFSGLLNLSEGFDLSSLIKIENNNITVDSSSVSQLNRSAELLLKGLGFVKTPIVLKDGQLCLPPSCAILSYAEGNFVFNVSGFSSYVAGENSQLNIFDSVDLGITGYENVQINFTANYTNKTSGINIINSTPDNGACNISFNVSPTGPFEMNFNFSGNNYYAFNRTFNSSGSYEWNVSCISDTFESLNTVDNISISSNQPPSIPDLIYPAINQTNITTRLPTFRWNASTDPENNSVIYDINITGGCGPIFVTNISVNNYTLTQELCTEDEFGGYTWTVRSFDNNLYSNWAPERNFSIAPYLSISLIQNNVNFGNMDRTVANDTTNDHPLPFVLENTGTVLANISISAEPMFTFADFPSEHFMMKIDNSSEVGSFNWIDSMTNWISASYNNVSMITELNYSDSFDTAEIDLLVDIPQNEYGALSTTIHFHASQPI